MKIIDLKICKPSYQVKTMLLSKKQAQLRYNKLAIISSIESPSASAL